MYACDIVCFIVLNVNSIHILRFSVESVLRTTNCPESLSIELSDTLTQQCTLTHLYIKTTCLRRPSHLSPFLVFIDRCYVYIQFNTFLDIDIVCALYLCRIELLGSRSGLMARCMMVYLLHLGTTGEEEGISFLLHSVVTR